MIHKYLCVYKNFFVLWTLLFVSACGHEKIIETYPNGQVKTQYYVDKKGLIQGEYLSYFESGVLKEKTQMKDGLIAGDRIIYYENGQVEIKEFYKDSSQIDGVYKAFYPNGTLKLEKTYVNQKIEGILRVYYPDGTLKEHVTFKDNNENGPFEEYYSNGGIHWRGQYLNGDNEFGLLEEFDSTGQIIKKMMCDSMAICRTFWRDSTQLDMIQ